MAAVNYDSNIYLISNGYVNVFFKCQDVDSKTAIGCGVCGGWMIQWKPKTKQFGILVNYNRMLY